MQKKDLTQITQCKKRKRRKMLCHGLVLGLFGLATFGTGLMVLDMTQTKAEAYLTDYDVVKNVFTEGKVAIELVEPKWDGDKSGVHPGDVYEKNPIILAGDRCVTPSFVYIQFKVPYADVTKVNDDSTLYDKTSTGTMKKATHMLLTFGEGELTKKADGSWKTGDASVISYDSASLGLDSLHGVKNNINSNKDGWTLLRVEDVPVSKVSDAAYIEGVNGYLVFTYAYNSMIANTDAVSGKYDVLVGSVIAEQTTPLFEQVRFINCMEGQLTGVKFKMPIKAFAIQSAHTGTGTDEDSNGMNDGNGNGLPMTTKDVIAQAKVAYAAYTNQNMDNGNATASVSSFSS